ncbi:hypothetical protein PS3A_05520 [Pseudomonas sp. 3A(2025)]
MDKNYDGIVDTLPHMRSATIHQETTLEQAVEYIDKMDLSMIHEKLCSGGKLLCRKWSAVESEIAINYYKNFLFLNKKYLKIYPVIPPSLEVDEVWHQHILDTLQYSKDCNEIFGHYFHHYPYFGMRGVQDAKNLSTAFEITQRLHQKEFGGPLLSIWEDLK